MSSNAADTAAGNTEVPMKQAESLYQRACRVIPGGVNSPVRAFQAVGGNPVYIASGRGATMLTVDGQTVVDFCGSWGPLILGHAHPKVVGAVKEAAERGTSFGTNTPREVELAELLCRLVPSLDRVRLVNSGTEATMTALRLARAATGRQRIVKFDGCYHGHSDGLLVSAGSGLLTGGILSSAGVPAAAAGDTLVAPYNDLSAIRGICEAQGPEIAGIIVEPIAGNMGVVPPEAGFLQGLRELADAHGAVLIFDEVISGFRLGPTTYGRLIGIRPDLTCLGKIIGGGMPIGAVGGRGDIMDLLAPLGNVYQAGTLSGNPVAVAAGLATLHVLLEDPPYDRMAERARCLAEGLNAAARASSVRLHCAVTGGMFTPFFGDAPVRNLAGAKACSAESHARFFHEMLDRGFYLPPSQFETAFVSAAHTAEHIEAFVSAAAEALKRMG